MKKILLMVLVCFLAVGVFAQTAVSVTNTVQVRAQMDPGADGSKLGRLREQVDLRITNDFINFHYRARLNMHAWASSEDLTNNFIKSVVPGMGDSQANLLLFPVSGLTFGVGTDFGWDVGNISLWDDDYFHLELDDPEMPGLMSFGSWGNKGFAGNNGGRPSRFAVNGLAAKYAIKGLELGASVPFQDFTPVKADGAKVGMRWGGKYTMADVFSLGVGFAGTFDPTEPWGIYAGATINAIEVVKPQIFYNYLDKGTKATDLQGQHNIGLRVPVKVGMLSLDPEFAVSINTLTKHFTAEGKKEVGKRVGAPMFAALPIAYQINDVLAVNLWYSFASGVRKAVDLAGGLKNVMDTRNIIRPGVKLNTGAGIFEVQCAVVLDSIQSKAARLGQANKTEVGYLLHMSWEKKF